VDPLGPHELPHLRSSRLPPIILVHNLGKEIPNQLVHRRIPLQSILPRLKKQIGLNSQRQIFHVLSVAHIMCILSEKTTPESRCNKRLALVKQTAGT
jgi:hypothetical protein